MSDTIPPRPVSLITILFLFVLFGAALFMAYHFYAPASVAAYDAAPENLTQELEWRADATSRREALTALKEEQQKQRNSYGWVDQQAGVVHIPVERAIQLTAEKYGAKQ